MKSTFFSIIKKGYNKKICQFLILIIPIIDLSLAMVLGNPSSSSPDMNEISNTENVEYQKGSVAAYNGKYHDAIKHLKRAAKLSPENPDVFNLLGYSNRKLDQFGEALNFYRMALNLDPRHLGANEYIGELYLQTQNIKKAEEHLEVLNDVCLFGCDEYDDLKQAIEKYKKNRK